MSDDADDLGCESDDNSHRNADLDKSPESPDDKDAAPLVEQVNVAVAIDSVQDVEYAVRRGHGGERGISVVPGAGHGGRQKGG